MISRFTAENPRIVPSVEHAEALLDGESWSDDQKSAGEAMAAGPAALTVCQAISMAMTVVLPAPVASFKASRISSGL
jgi:hypothetical protein